MNKDILQDRLNLRKQYRRNKNFRFVVQIFGVIFGSVISGLCFKTFFTSAEIIPSGFSGVALIIAEKVFHRAGLTSIIYLIINVIFFLIALKLFGWKYLVLTLIGLGAYTLAMQFISIPSLANAEFANDKLLFAVIGGGLAGLGQGIAFRMGGSTGGSDVAANIINKLNPRIKTGMAVLIINMLVITLTVFVNGWQTALYAVIVAVMSKIVCDMVLDGVKTVRAFYIICDKDEEISQAILDRFHRGVTLIPAQGRFSGKEKKLLLCLVANSQSREMKEIVKDIDKNAFVFSTSVNETLGDGYFMKEVSVRKNKIRQAAASAKKDVKLSRLKCRPKENFGKKFKNASFAAKDKK